MKLYPFQIPSQQRLLAALKKYPAALDASQTGTGKTYVALAVAKTLNLRPAIVCPKSVIPSWERIAQDAGLKPYFIRNYEALKTLKYPELKSQISFARGKKAILQWILKPDTLLIFDEAHRCKGVDTINCKMAVAALGARVKTLLLSATIASNPLEMNALGTLLNLHQGWNFWKWCRQNGCINSPWGGLMYVGGPKKLEVIHGRIFPERGTRIRIQDLGDLFPETLISAEAYEMDTKKLQKVYEEMEHQLAELQARTIDDNKESPLTIMLRARQQAELIKVPTLVELAEDGVEEGNSIAIFVNFTDTLLALETKLKKFNPQKVYGNQTAEERQKAIDRFQADRSRVILCNTAAGGVGISLHDLRGIYPRLSLLSPAYSAINLVQCLGRIHRAGGKSKSIQRIIFAAGCIEEEACKAVKKKIECINTLNDGDLKSGIIL